MNAVYLLSETGIALLFALCLAFATAAARHNRHDKGRALSLVLSAALFAALFENLNVLQVHGRGSYSYNAQFHVFIDQVPLFVVLSWAVILWTAMQISDATALRTRHKIACDAVLAVGLDLAFDATAIRHNFWFWHGVGFDQAWFGIPAGNFFGWMFVALAFSFCSRTLDFAVQTGKLKVNYRVLVQLVLVPPVAFGLYRATETLNNAMLTICGWRADLPQTDRFALCVFLVQFFALMWWSLRQRKTVIEYSKHDKTVLAFARICRVFFHVFAVAGLLVLSATTPFLAQQKPALLAVAGFFWMLDWLYTKRLRATSN